VSERFSDDLRRAAGQIWSAQHAHPFVRAIGEGTLGRDRFAHWVRQDYRFLTEYCRLFGLAAARSPDLVTLTRFAELLRATAVAEMSLHRRLADPPIEDLELSVRALNCLKANDVTKVGQLVAMRQEDLLTLRNFGAKSLDEIKEKLVEREMVTAEELETLFQPGGR